MANTITIAGNSFPIVIRKHARSKRIVLRYQPLQQYVSLTLPRYASIRQGLSFVEEKRNWIERQVHDHGARVPFVEGQVIPVIGKEYTLVHQPGRGVVMIEDTQLIVPGEKEFIARRLREWLKNRLRAEITRLCAEKAKLIGKRPGRISLRDTSSRWGSCSHDGDLSFSWRLIFAPYEVIDYLVSHEIAHLAEHNHGPAFWAHVESLCPKHDHCREWLKSHGYSLYMYG